MLIKYHGKLCDINTTVEDGEKEFDLFDDNINLDETIKLSKNELENTTQINSKDIINISEDEKHE